MHTDLRKALALINEAKFYIDLYRKANPPKDPSKALAMLTEAYCELAEGQQ